MSTPTYFYRDATGQDIGPLPLDALPALRLAKVVNGNTLVRAADTADWRPYREVIADPQPLSPEEPPPSTPAIDEARACGRFRLMLLVGVMIVSVVAVLLVRRSSPVNEETQREIDAMFDSIDAKLGKPPTSGSSSEQTSQPLQPQKKRLPVGQRKGELTRELATEILNEHLATPSVRSLAFKNGGIDLAKQDGIIQEQGGFPPSYRFTDKGLKMLGSVIGQNYIELAPFGLEAPKCALKNGIGQRVSEVSGIAEGPTPNIKSVEYVTAYLFPPEMQPMTRYMLSGRKSQSVFQKYDDGWRVAR